MTTFPPSPAQGETAGVSEATVWIVSKRGKEALGWALEAGGKVGANDCLMVDAADYDALRQQLAELQRERDEHRGCAIALEQQQLAEMRGLLSLSRPFVLVCDGTQFLVRDIDAALAPTSQPSREPECACGHPYACGAASQPSRGKCEPYPYSDLTSHLAWALKGLHDDNADYLRINLLGGYDNHWMKAARGALAAFEEARSPVGEPDCAQPERQGAGLIADLMRIRSKMIARAKNNPVQEDDDIFDAIILGEAIAALVEKVAIHQTHHMDNHCINCGLSTEDERIKQACDP